MAAIEERGCCGGFSYSVEYGILAKDDGPEGLRGRDCWEAVLGAVDCGSLKEAESFFGQVELASVYQFAQAGAGLGDGTPCGAYKQLLRFDFAGGGDADDVLLDRELRVVGDAGAGETAAVIVRGIDTGSVLVETVAPLGSLAEAVDALDGWTASESQRCPDGFAVVGDGRGGRAFARVVTGSGEPVPGRGRWPDLVLAVARGQGDPFSPMDVEIAAEAMGVASGNVRANVSLGLGRLVSDGKARRLCHGRYTLNTA